jgi:hypothetical protein
MRIRGGRLLWLSRGSLGATWNRPAKNRRHFDPRKHPLALRAIRLHRGWSEHGFQRDVIAAAANKILNLKPGLFGVGINVNELIDRRKKARRNAAKNWEWAAPEVTSVNRFSKWVRYRL